MTVSLRKSEFYPFSNLYDPDGDSVTIVDVTLTSGQALPDFITKNSSGLAIYPT